MISNNGAGYWSMGITVRHVEGRGWAGRLEYLDDGWVGDDDPDAGKVSTEGELRTRYHLADGTRVSGLRATVDKLIADADRLGITLAGPGDQPPTLWYHGDGEHAEWPPPEGWRELLGAEAARLGWRGP